MDLLICAYLLSKKPRPNLQEFLHLQKHFEQGGRIHDIEIQRISPTLAKILRDENFTQTWRKVSDEIQKAQEQNCEFIYPGHQDYPLEYNFIEDQPLFLSYIGKPIWKKSCNFAVVGSREPTRLSEIWCEQVLSEILKSLQVCIVSGGARGIDQCAHRVAIRNQKPTLVFLPSGLLNPYPASVQSWKSAILETEGAFISEYLPTAMMQKHFFQQRNRLISGISFATLVVEAKRKSGTYMTARLTADQNKPLFVIPSHPLDLSNQGGLDLITEGATLVTCADDLINYIQSELRSLIGGQIDVVGNENPHH